VRAQQAILLLGPTGAGKTPLGDCLDEHGLWGCACAHFDFGAQLRRAAGSGGSASAGLSAEQTAVIGEALQSGRLLTDAEFPIAAALLRAFLVERRVGERDWLVLNGLPRHAGQADAIDRFAHVKVVVALRCSPEVVRERIRLNTGGDRAGRTDDSREAVAAKLELYTERTQPLLDHYAARGARLVAIDVDANTPPGDVVARIPTLA
jgi:adenylate kinase family enzyme